MLQQWHRWKKRLLSHAKIRNLLRYAFILPRHREHLQAALRRLPAKSNPTHSNSPRPKVLLLAFRHWTIHRGWEALITRLLQARGCEVVWATCDGLMERCDAMLAAIPEHKLCRYCQRFNSTCSEIVEARHISLRSFLHLGEAPLCTEQCTKLEAHCLVSLQRMLGSSLPQIQDLSEEDTAIWEQLKRSAAKIHQISDPLFTAVNPDLVIALNGKFYSESILLEQAKTRGIPCWTYERGNRKDTIVLAAADRAIPFATKEIIDSLDQPLSEYEEQQLDQYLEQRSITGNGQVRFLDAQSKAPERRIGRRRLSLFTNLIWDSAVVGEDLFFDDMFSWIRSSIEFAKSSNTVDLHIRVHPAEERVYWHPTRDRVMDMINQHYPDGLPDNVFIHAPSDAIDSYALVQSSDLVLTYASSIGMEAAAMGKPVIVAARSNHSSAPFVHLPNTKQEYLDFLSSEVLLPPTKASVLARRFLYRLYFEYMLPLDTIEEDPMGFKVSEGVANLDQIHRWLDRHLAAIGHGLVRT